MDVWLYQAKPSFDSPAMATREERLVVIQKIGFTLVGIGGLILIGWSVRGFFLAENIPLVIRIAVGAIGVGLLILIGSVVRDRVATARTEDFQEVKP